MRSERSGKFFSSALLAGAIGFHILNEAMARGLEVTAVARHPHFIKTSEKIVVVQADEKDASNLARIAESHDAVVSSMSPTWGEAGGVCLPQVTNRNALYEMMDVATSRLKSCLEELIDMFGN